MIGGIVAGAFFVIPSVFVLLGLSWIYAAHGSVPAVAGVLDGLKPVVVAIVIEAVWKIGRRALKRGLHVAIAAAAFVAIFLLHVPFPWIVLAAGLVGLAGARLAPAAFSTAPSAPLIFPAGAAAEPVLSDDALPAAHTLPSARRNAIVLAAGVLLWIAPLLLLGRLRGWESLHVREYRFFTQAALVTFGGAYAALAYVTQAAVDSFGWLTHAQAVDGLALAETTPGPLIMVLQFVGFLAAWNRPEGMTSQASAVIGALVTSWTIFLPCFLFIFLGAPYIEVLRGKRTLAAALTGITSAVVGVILNLALVFGSTVLFPRGWEGGADPLALVVGLAALVLLSSRVNFLWLIAGGAAAGLVRSLLGA
jgi:chromate transporter